MEPEQEPGSSLGKGLPGGSHHYRAFVGPPEKYDLIGAMQFNLLTWLGLREHHYLLDIGCGSLKSGRLFIPYLLPGRYFGIEPEEWLIEEGIRRELGQDLIRLKRPSFSHDANFTLTVFERSFDFLIANSIFSHASARQIARCLSEARRVMTPTSVFAATFVKGEENYKGDEWVYPGCVTYTFDYIRELVEDHGLKCAPIEWHHPAKQTWIMITDPSGASSIARLDDPKRIVFLEKQLELCKERLVRMKGHPYVRFGFKVRSLLRRIRGRTGHLAL